MEMRKWHCWFMEFYYISVRTLISRIFWNDKKWALLALFHFTSDKVNWNLLKFSYYLIAICKSKVYYTNYLHICSLCHSWLEINFLIFHGQCWKRTVTTTVVQLTLCLILTNFSPFGTRASSEKTCVNWRTPVFE